MLLEPNFAGLSPLGLDVLLVAGLSANARVALGLEALRLFIGVLHRSLGEPLAVGDETVHVDSAATERLMIALHRSLVHGLSPPTALRRAALSLRNDPAFAHPFYWAPFVVIGSGR